MSDEKTESIKEVKEPKKKAAKVPSVPEEYSPLKEDFSQIIKRGVEGFQEKTPGRQIEHVTMRLQGRYGLIVQTNNRGLIEVPEMSGMEMDNQGNKKKQRMFIGMNSSVATKKMSFASVTMLRPGETTIKEFEANAGAHELLKFSITRAQKAGEELQRQIDEEGKEYFPRLIPPTGQEASVNWDVEGQPSIDRIFNLVSLARQTLKSELGSKLDECKVVFFNIVDTMELSDTTSNKLDVAVPRTGFAIQAKTSKGQTVFQSIRGVGGFSTITRHDKSKTAEETVEAMAKKVAKQAVDIDRAQPCSVLEGEAWVVLDGEIVGTLAHEVYGHTSEADIIVANKRDKDVDLNLKSRLGGQVSENNKFNIIDCGHHKVMLGDKEITNCFGAVIVDDEGTVAKRTPLVEKGIQIMVLNSANTINEIAEGLPEEIKTRLLEHGLSGNVRNERFDKPPMVRMTNTFILPNETGPDSVEKLATLIPKTKRGVYVVSCSGGWVQPDSGNFQVTGQLGYLIENGIITDKPVKDLIIRGNITKFGSKIKAIGNAATVKSSTGYCGKDRQWVPVEDGGPAILVEDVPIGEEPSYDIWGNSYKEYRRQMSEVAQGKRAKNEVYFRFLEEANKDAKNHHELCMLVNCMPVVDEVDLLMGNEPELADYQLGENGKLEEK